MPIWLLCFLCFEQKGFYIADVLRQPVSDASRGINSHGECGKTPRCSCFTVPPMEVVVVGGGISSITSPKIEENKTQKKGKSRRREGRKVDKCGENNARVDRKRWRKRCGDAVRWLMCAHCSVGLLAATVALLPLTLCNGALSPVALRSFATSATSPFRKLWDAYSWWKRWIGLTRRLICDSCDWMRHFSVNQLRWDCLVLNEACLMRHSFHSFHFQLHLLFQLLLNNYKANHWNTLPILNIMGMKDDISHIFRR